MFFQVSFACFSLYRLIKLGKSVHLFKMQTLTFFVQCDLTLTCGVRQRQNSLVVSRVSFTKIQRPVTMWCDDVTMWRCDDSTIRCIDQAMTEQHRFLQVLGAAPNGAWVLDAPQCQSSCVASPCLPQSAGRGCGWYRTTGSCDTSFLFCIFLFMDSIEFERQSFLPKPLAFHEEHLWFSHEFPAAVGSMVMCQLVHFVAFCQGLASSSPLCPAICAHTWCDSGQVTAWKSCSASCWHCFMRPGAGECWLLGQKAKAEKREGVISGRKVRNGAWNGPSKSHRTSLGLTWDGYI